MVIKATIAGGDVIAKLVSERERFSTGLERDKTLLAELQKKEVEADRKGESGKHKTEIDHAKEKVDGGILILKQVAVDHREAVRTYQENELKQNRAILKKAESKRSEGLKNIAYYQEQIQMASEQIATLETEMESTQGKIAEAEKYESESVHKRLISLEDLKKLRDDPMSIVDREELKNLIKSWSSMTLKEQGMSGGVVSVESTVPGHVESGYIYVSAEDGKIVLSEWMYHVGTSGKRTTNPVIILRDKKSQKIIDQEQEKKCSLSVA